ncbi:MAG: helix-turn-helix domain-containing protein, partial [Acetobacteraceae bacterium]|nr:helix-turn-helix domain-containing protein [Acetobacteraceae bacterium]
LAEATDLSLEMIGRLERGLTAPSFDTIAAIADALQVALAELFGAEPSAITGERREILNRINKLLASASDPELRRAERVLTAMLRD